MISTTVELRTVEGTQAAMDWAGGHTIVVDRPEGKAGGLGLGFNGAQLLALAIGGCFCNDLRYVGRGQKGLTFKGMIAADFVAWKRVSPKQKSKLLALRKSVRKCCYLRAALTSSHGRA